MFFSNIVSTLLYLHFFLYVISIASHFSFTVRRSSFIVNGLSFDCDYDYTVYAAGEKWLSHFWSRDLHMWTFYPQNVV